MASALSPGGYVRQGQRGVCPPRSVNVQVAVRCRPLNERERSAGERPVLQCSTERREVVCAAPSGPRKGASSSNPKKTFTYDHVFGPDATQADVYEGIVEPIVDEVLQGYNCTVFAYGQTGTGKTHTMEGRRDADMAGIEERRLAENAGIIPRAVKQVFDHLRSITDEHSVRVSHLELYNEQLTDLLGPEDVLSDYLRMYEDPHKGTFVQGLEDIVVRSEEEIFAVLDKSAVKRRTAETLMNKYSSRSHSVFSITIHIKESTPEGADLLKVGKLNLVDLAGSENVGRSGAVKGRAREAGNINQSLLTLGRVITALVDRHPHVPYRDSKLTRLLQESLGGRNKTCVIATVTPGSNSNEETASTLDYAYRAKSIKNRPTVNQMIAKHVLLKEYTEEIQKLKKQLDCNRAKNGVYLPSEEFERLQMIASQQKDTISDLESRTEEFEKKTSTLKEKLEKTQTALARDQKDLENTKRTLSSVKKNLETTKNHLAVANQQREENAHLVRSHVATENSLYDQGTQLQSTVSVCLSDIRALHGRVNEKWLIEKENVANLSRLQSAIGSNVKALQMSLTEHEQQQSVVLQESNTILDKMSNVVEDGLTSIRRNVQGFSLQFGEVEEANAKAGAALMKGFQDTTEEGLQKVRRKIDDQRAAVSDAEQKVSDLGSSIMASLESSRQALSEMKLSVTKHNEKQETRQKAFAENMARVFMQLDEDVDGHVKRQEAIFEEMKLSASKELDNQKELARNMQEKLIAQVTNSLQTFVQESTDSAIRAAALNDGRMNNVSKESVLVRNVVGKANDSLATKCQDLSRKFGDDAIALREDIAGGELRIVDFCDDAGTGVEAVTATAADLSKSTANLQGDVAKDLTALQLSETRLQEESAEQHASFAKDLKSCVDAHEEQTETTNAELESAMSSIENDMRGKMSSVQHKVSLFAETGMETINSTIREPVQSHAIKEDLKHDETPMARQWPISEKLSRTRDHKKLINEMRLEKGYVPVQVEDFGHEVENCSQVDVNDLPSSESAAASVEGEDRPPIFEHTEASQLVDESTTITSEEKVEDMEGSSSSVCDPIEASTPAEEPETSVVLADTTNRRLRRVRPRKIIPSIAKKPSGIPAPRTRSHHRVGGT